MRRLLVLAVALVAILGVLAPPAMAQAPAPKVTITGLIDQVGTYTKNMSQYDGNININRDRQLYGRTRGRFDVIGEVGKAKALFRRVRQIAPESPFGQAALERLRALGEGG